jgi:hypothetical protein
LAKKAATVLTTGRILPRDSQAGAARVLEAMIRGVDVSQRKGASMRVEIVITPAAKIVVGKLTRRIVSPTKGRDPNNKAEITTAKRRGEKTVASILSGPEMVSGEHFAELIGMTRMAVHMKLKKHKILGLQGAKRGVRYPTWQLDDYGRPIPGLSEVLVKFGDATWAAYRFLRQHHAGLGRKTAIDALKVGKKKAVLEAAEAVLSGDFS